jgi:hypothetical protein
MTIPSSLSLYRPMMMESSDSFRSKRTRRHVLTSVVTQIWEDALSIWKDWTQNEQEHHHHHHNHNYDSSKEDAPKEVHEEEKEEETSSSLPNKMDMVSPYISQDARPYPRPILLDKRKLSTSSNCTTDDAPPAMEFDNEEDGRRANLQRMKRVSWTDR